MEILIAIIGSGVLSTLISCIFTAAANRRKEKAEANKEDDALVIAMRQLYYGRIKRHAKHYIAAAQITSEELEDIVEDHRIYHDVLCGNGYLDNLMSKVRGLDIID